MCLLEKTIEYEDYDNATELHHVNEYDYEEEDERYGPAEREGEFLFEAQVIIHTIGPEIDQRVLLCCYINASSQQLSFLVRIYQRKDRKESQGIWHR